MRSHSLGSLADAELANVQREEFLNEAIAFAPAGIVSLLIDAPQARPGFKPTPNRALIAQQVIDLRRGVDLLLSCPDVDAKRIAYVGHSWDAGTGAILDAIDKRIAAFVFMAGPQSNRQYVLFSDSPRMVSARKSMDLTKVEQTMQTNAWADPGSYARILDHHLLSFNMVFRTTNGFRSRMRRTISR